MRRNTGGDFLSCALGYSLSELKSHIEKSFERGMNWSRFSAGEIHIDHIIPLSTFNLEDDAELRRAFALTNLRPMWAKANLSKGSKVLTLL